MIEAISNLTAGASIGGEKKYQKNLVRGGKSVNSTVRGWKRVLHGASDGLRVSWGGGVKDCRHELHRWEIRKLVKDDGWE